MSSHKLELRFSALSLADYEDIMVYTRTEWGDRQVEVYSKKFDVAFDTIARQPYIGIAKDKIIDGLRMFHIGGHIILYQVEPDYVMVFRIFHEKMDIDRVILQ